MAVAKCYRRALSLPVKLSDSLMLTRGRPRERSIAGQVQFWARLGRSVELLLGGQQVACPVPRRCRSSLVIEEREQRQNRKSKGSRSGSPPFSKSCNKPLTHSSIHFVLGRISSYTRPVANEGTMQLEKTEMSCPCDLCRGAKPPLSNAGEPTVKLAEDSPRVLPPRRENGRLIPRLYFGTPAA